MPQDCQNIYIEREKVESEKIQNMNISFENTKYQLVEL